MTRRIALFTTLTLLTVSACDPTTSQKQPSQTNQTTAPAPEPFEIVPTMWSASETAATYELRQLPDGSPGLFDEDGALLIQLVPDVVVDVAPAGKPRIKPARHRFEVLKLEAIDGGGLRLAARASDRNGSYELRIEKGAGDPRIHAELTTKWARDVDVHRLLVAFRTGQSLPVAGLGSDYTWANAKEEWIPPAHTPSMLRFGKGGGAFTVVGRAGAEGIAAHRREDDTWDVELEVYHYDNHPLDFGNACSQKDLGGVARFDSGETSVVRADVVVGSFQSPVVTRFPGGHRASVSLVDAAAKSPRAVSAEDDAVQVVPAERVFAGDLAKAECTDELGRFGGLASGGVAFARSSSMVSSDANLLAGDEADARRVVFFEHPDAASVDGPIGLFRTAEREGSIGSMFAPESLEALQRTWGLASWLADPEEVLRADASPTTTVRDALTAAVKGGQVWVAAPSDIGRFVLGSEDIDVDVLPNGVLRVRNLGDEALDGVTVWLPEGTHARLAGAVEHNRTRRWVSVNLAPRGEQLMQLFRGDESFAPVAPAMLKWAYDPAGPSVE